MGTPRLKGLLLNPGIVFSLLILFFCIPNRGRSQTEEVILRKWEKPPYTFSFVVRDFDTDNLLPGVDLRLFAGSTTIATGTTNDLGYAELPLRIKFQQYWFDDVLKLSYAYIFRGSLKIDTIRINRFLEHYELYTPPDKVVPYDSSNLIADAHLQTSLRAHNHFANQLYVSNWPAPENLNWFVSYKGKSTLHKNNRWYCTNLEPLGSSPLLQDRREMMRKLLVGCPTSCMVHSTNKLTHYTQATYSNLKMGRVALSFNPITPIEKAVANTLLRRFANHNVSGLSYPWLSKINGKMTHWENFVMEYKMLMGLSRTYNYFPVRFYTSGMDLDTNLTTIVNCAEGGHILQGPLVSRKIDRIMQNPNRASEKFFNDVIDSLKESELAWIKQQIQGYIDKADSNKLKKDSTLIDTLKQVIKDVAPDTIDMITDSFMLKELLDNVKKLKDTDSFHIWMINIAHHTYNHLVGHAVAFDQGGLIGGFLAKFMHNAHTSNEHYDTWRKMYYNISGPNKFGRRVVDSLITRNDQGHRILIDLKHSSYATRKWYLDSVIVNHFDRPREKTPPVCSHCAANGLKEIEYSRYADEFTLRNAPLANTFYPFELNLFDEEITRIFQLDGLIGINLEQRGLGGYINKHDIWRPGIKHTGKLKPKDSSLAQRFSYVKRLLKYYEKTNPAFLTEALDYIRTEMEVTKQPLDILISDYISAEPFLQNLFYLIDHSGYPDPQDAWKQLCLGSDLDGVINPIEICHSASQYPEFKKRIRHFIPIFLRMRMEMYPKRNPKPYAHYFSNDAELDEALNYLFFLSAKNFVENHFIDKKM